MIFANWRLDRAVDRTCLEQVIREQDKLRIVDLERPKMLGPDHDRREYTALMGIFTEDMMYKDIPVLTWYLRRNGSLWSEWQVQAPQGSPLYNYYMSRPGNDRKTYSWGVTYSCPMRLESKNYITELAREHWVMHKMGSETLL